MSVFNYNKWNLITGWIVFALSLITYTLTVEPTVSFWDAGEYIATSANLEVGHPPGAPFYQMLGAFFSMFAISSQHIALMVNMVAVFSSAFTILFLFWSSTNILKKIVIHSSEWNNSNAIAVLGSSAVGALAFTFSDSFWFNAVEAEVYASAMFFISLLLWLGIRWVDDIDKPRGNKWLLLISLIIGLSFGVHLMALLTIPSIGFLYYFKKYKKITILNFVVANIIIVAILLFIFMFLFPSTLSFFGKMEIFMVNQFGMPFNSGTILSFIIIVLFFVLGLRYTGKHEKVFYNTILLCILFIFIGFTSWLMLPIRSNANTVINENRPSDAAELLAYYNREQYGTQKLSYDAFFSARYSGLDKKEPYINDKPNYERDYSKGKYVIVNNYINAVQNMDSNHKGFLPRMWSTDNSHRVNYMRFTKPLDFTVKREYADKDEVVDLVSSVRKGVQTGEIEMEGLDKFFNQYGQYLDISKPSFSDNIKFMFEYQFGYMYWRYLMWNFVGRQNDIQGNYDAENGNWISGIKFLDSIRLGSQDNLPSDVLNNKARNTYFFLPFILGVIGFVFHFRKEPKSFYVMLALFLFTSIALKIFLNERPFEPRERDYAVVGSFMVFAFWIGLGVYAIYDGAKKFISPKIAGPVVIVVSLLCAPVLMAWQNWDDHDRSDRYTALANAKAYLDSCDPNAILFTIGDNDTFPLWYVQEIEGYRTDVRVVCTSLLPQDWYIDQMRAKAHKSEPLPIEFTHKQYVAGTRDVVFIEDMTDERIDIKQFLRFIKSDDPRTTRKMDSGQTLHLAPTGKIRIQVDSLSIAKNNIVSENLRDQVVPYIDLDIKTNVIYKHFLMMLEIIANNNWERPIYFSGGSNSDEDYVWLKDYLQLSGLAYKLVPIKNDSVNKENVLGLGSIDSDRMYNIVMKWDWGNGGSTKIYHDPQTRRNSLQYRINLSRLTKQLIEEGKFKKAKDIADLVMDNFPIDYYQYYSLVDSFVEAYYKIGEKQIAREISERLIVKYQEQLNYYKSLDRHEQDIYYFEIIKAIESYREVLKIAKESDVSFYDKATPVFNNYNKTFARFKRDSL